jgi:hypothetical protein
VFSDPVTIAGGTINDNGGTDIDAGTNSVTIVGTVAPGQSPGILTVTGNFAFASNDTFEVEIGGTDPGNSATDHDQIDVTGTVTIGNNVTLDLSAFGGFLPSGIDEYVIINNDGADAVIGTFDGLAEGATISNFLVPGRTATITYVGGTGGNDVVITTNPALACWDLAVDGDWNDPTKWDTGFVPTAGDDVCIDETGASYIVTLNVNVNAADALGSFLLDSADATFVASSRTFAVDGASNLDDGTVNWASSTWTGAGTLTNAADFNVSGGSAISSAFVQSGNVNIRANADSNAALTVASGFTNSGTIDLEDPSNFSRNATIAVSSGTLLNSNTGVINVQADASSASSDDRQINANLTNDGVVNINENSRFSLANATFINNGDVNIATNKTFEYLGTDQVFTQAGGTLDVLGAFAWLATRSISPAARSAAMRRF